MELNGHFLPIPEKKGRHMIGPSKLLSCIVPPEGNIQNNNFLDAFTFPYTTYKKQNKTKLTITQTIYFYHSPTLTFFFNLFNLQVPNNTKFVYLYSSSSFIKWIPIWLDSSLITKWLLFCWFWCHRYHFSIIEFA